MCTCALFFLFSSVHEPVNLDIVCYSAKEAYDNDDSYSTIRRKVGIGHDRITVSYVYVLENVMAQPASPSI